MKRETIEHIEQGLDPEGLIRSWVADGTITADNADEQAEDLVEQMDRVMPGEDGTCGVTVDDMADYLRYLLIGRR